MKEPINAADVRMLTRMLAANTLKHYMKCAAHYHGCGRAATHWIEKHWKELGYAISDCVYCEGHADGHAERSEMKPLLQRGEVLELERTAWGKGQ